MTIAIGAPTAGMTDGCSMFAGASGASFYKVTNAHNTFNNAGQPTANILIPA
jgi:hypothetical protein